MKKIMFNDKYGLTDAVLEGRKTQTRRIAYDGIVKDPNIGYGLEGSEKDKCVLCSGCMIVAKSTYHVGEEIAIAQRYSECFRAVCLENSKGWNNKMFVMAELMPHRIKITNIRVERLQDISEEDCLKEGVYYHTEPPRHHEYDRYSPWSPSVKPYKFESEKYFCSAKYAFKHLIEKVSGKGTWDSNPYVFVYDFELIK